LGIDNVVALRGDALKTETYFKPEKDGNEYATDLVLQISNLNKGIYLDEDLQNTSNTNFCIGVAGYPEKHMEAPSLDSDIHFLKQKIKNGADYIITQMFFDNQKFFEYVAKCRNAGITVPIIPGLKPIATKKQLNLIPHRFSLELPDDLIMAVVKAKDNDAVKQIGIEWCIEQSKELLAAGIPVLHYYSMGKAENIKSIAKTIF
jgi:methylenetetrahydrofolate reductase (NADPH)